MNHLPAKGETRRGPCDGTFAHEEPTGSSQSTQNENRRPQETIMKPIATLSRIALLAAVALLPAARAHAQASVVKAELLADTTAVQAGETFHLGIRLHITKGWHIYWRNPGQAGMATDVKLHLPEGFESHKLLWPDPKTFKDAGGIVTYGYEDEVLLQARIKAPQKIEAKLVEVSAEVSYLACKEKCLPGQAQASVQLPTGKARPENQKLFAAWADRTPPAAADFTLKDAKGNDVSLSDFHGKVVVLEWINWDCPFVVRHMKAGTMADLARKYAAKDVVWLGVNSTKYHGAETNAEKISRYNLPYPVLDDHPGTVGHLYQAKTTPHMFVIDQAGQIVYSGAIDNDPRGRKPADQRVNFVEKVLALAVENQPVSLENQKPYGCSVKYAD
jgi:DsbC/DsbD-like thiol-disulfide interchange protein